MSTESFQAFTTKIQEDEDLRKEIQDASDEKGIAVEKLAAIAAGHGYEFTAEDVSDELTDAQLEGVAGGFGRANSISSLSTYKIESYDLSGSMYVKFDLTF